ncbi:hypothetical protein SLEP1_g8679 [Rubroshorea leprosula]|uniref:Uncharacterized protein n=1 Tax=Rubroshorea leprosula TaxID=152421 RepID=A0AAV5IDK2_9ROSI|nr:hypothetical protein SLEP1_g8679 [Rubroshorea leprosula]
MAFSLIELIKNFWVKLDNLITKPIQPNVHKLIIAILFSSFMVIGLVMWQNNRTQEENLRLVFAGIAPGLLLQVINFNEYIPEIREWRCLRLKGPIIETMNAISGWFIAFGLSKVFLDAESMLNFVFAGLFFLMTLSIWDLLGPEIDLGLVSGLCSFLSIKAPILATRYERIPVGIVAISLLYVRFRRAEAGKDDQSAEQSGQGQRDI